MKIETLLVKAFTQNSEEGNPAGIVIDAQFLEENQMLLIATMLGYSESAFVFPSTKAAFKVRFFTPTKEVPLCGHGTIATFYSLIMKGKITFADTDIVESSQETSAGVLQVTCHKDGLIVMEQAKPFFYKTVFDPEIICNLLGISRNDLAEFPIELVSTGSPKLMIPVTSLAVLEKIQPNLEAMKEFCAHSEVRGFYPFTLETNAESDFHARQFNPFAGIDEDPVTGVAAGALGAYAVKNNLLEKNEFVVEQGYFMNKGGKMYVKIDGDRVTVGGYATIFASKEIEV